MLSPSEITDLKEQIELLQNMKEAMMTISDDLDQMEQSVALRLNWDPNVSHTIIADIQQLLLKVNSNISSLNLDLTSTLDRSMMQMDGITTPPKKNTASILKKRLV